MANRETKVTLTAQVAGYISGMDAAAKKTKETASAAEKLNAQKQGLEALGKAGMAVGALAAAGAAIAVAKFAEFDAAMSKVRAATHETTANMQLLRDAAIQAGDGTVFSAAEAAGAIEELARAGVSTADILNGGLAGALDLAAAGGLAVADAAGIASTALAQFKLEGSDVGHVADLLAAGAGKAMGDVSDLSQALAQGGQVASATGLTIEETTAALSAFASQGLLGSDAGTSFKSMLQRLNPSTAEAQRLMDEFNLSAYDASGNFVGLSEYAGQLQEGLSGLTVEQRQSTLATLFGSDAIRAATVLYSEGADGIAEWESNVNDAGYAAETARIRLDNLQGDLEKLGGSIDSVLIQGGSAANASLRTLTQGATGVVDAIGDLPEPVLNVGLAAAGLVGTMGVLGGAAVLAVPKIAEFKGALGALNIAGSSVARSVGGATVALGVAGAAFAVWAERQAKATANTQDFLASLDEATGAVTDYTRKLVAQKLASEGVFDAVKKEGISQRALTDAVMEGGKALDDIQAKLSGRNNVVDFFNGSGIAAGNAGRALDGIAGSLQRAGEDFENQKAAAEGSAEATESAADSYRSAAEEASQLSSNLQQLIDTVNEANGVGQDAVSANAAYQSALEGVRNTIAEAQKGADGYSTSLDESTAAGASNAAMFAELAAKSQSAAQAQLALDGDTQKYRSTLEAGRQALYDQILALTGNADAAQALTDKIYAMPSQKQIDILAETTAAQEALDRFIFNNNGKTITLHAAVAGARASVTNGTGMGGFKDGGMIPHLSGGSPTWWRDGVVQGPGGPRDDRVAAMLSPGEFVVNADATAKHRELLYALNSGHYSSPAMNYAHLSAAPPVVHNNSTTNINMAPIRDNDPQTTATVLGREIRRSWAS